MTAQQQEEFYCKEDAEKRLRKTLTTAFDMKPTPLKDIPKRTGESRKLARTKRRASAAT